GLLSFPTFQNIPHNPWPMILAHAGAFAAFFWVTIVLMEGPGAASELNVSWLLAWAATGIGAGAFWMLAAMPAREWIRFARESSSFLSAGIIITAASWILGFLSNRSWEPLQGPTLLAVHWLLQAFQQDVLSQPAVHWVGTTQFSVGIYPACAGYEGIGLIAVFLALYFWLFRRNLRFPQAFILLPLGILIIYLLNALRVASLILVGTHVSPQIALGGFHSQTGWIAFIAVALSMVAVTQKMSFFAANPTDLKTKAREGNPTAAYLAPLMALLAFTMVTGMFSSGFDWLYPARVLGTGAAIWFFWRGSMTRVRLAGAWSWDAIGIGVAVFAVWMGLEWAMGNSGSGSSIPKPLGEMTGGWAAAWISFRALGSVVTVPIAEELAFRGYLLRRLISADFDRLSSPRFTWLSFLVSSVLFGALHGRWLAGTVAGMFYAWAMYRRGRVGDAIIAHAATNALIAAVVLGFGEWKLWE
ncbi:MAG: exosortase E/protease, VPEID-CTERM system, partial [Thermodesulfobacteriota bacterium]|nr:exosortase E/protease, VPEID-CTERM system [Thermodesulfobacteriota bacterium]